MPSPASDKRSRARRLGRRVSLVLLTVLAVVVGWAVAVAAFFGTAAVCGVIAVLLVVAVCASLLAGTGSAWLAARLMRCARPGRFAGGVGITGTVLLALLAALTVLRPLPSTRAARQSPSVPAGVAYWNLSTGSRLAYLEIPAAGKPKPEPVIVVGGGPGEEDVADPAQTRFFGRLAHLGYDVYVYDQLGAGLSARLNDPTGYTVARHVADLEAIRRHLGARWVILMGLSWGGSLVASYMARHPHRVAKAIFTSPAPLDYARWPDAGSVASRLPPARRRQADELLPGTPRFVLWYALGGINPQAAHHLVPDREADAYFNTYLHLVRPGTVCDPAHLPDQYETGNGFYDNVFTTRDAEAGHTQSAVRALLAHNHTPALILTGGCNYVPWAATRQYKTTLPDSTLLCFPHAGHVIYLDQPDLYLRTIDAFLLGKPLPVPPWTVARPCS